MPSKLEKWIEAAALSGAAVLPLDYTPPAIDDLVEGGLLVDGLNAITASWPGDGTALAQMAARALIDGGTVLGKQVNRQVNHILVVGDHAKAPVWRIAFRGDQRVDVLVVPPRFDLAQIGGAVEAANADLVVIDNVGWMLTERLEAYASVVLSTALRALGVPVVVLFASFAGSSSPLGGHVFTPYVDNVAWIERDKKANALLHLNPGSTNAAEPRDVTTHLVATEPVIEEGLTAAQVRQLGEFARGERIKRNGATAVALFMAHAERFEQITGRNSPTGVEVYIEQFATEFDGDGNVPAVEAGLSSEEPPF